MLLSSFEPKGHDRGDHIDTATPYGAFVTDLSEILDLNMNESKKLLDEYIKQYKFNAPSSMFIDAQFRKDRMISSLELSPSSSSLTTTSSSSNESIKAKILKAERYSELDAIENEISGHPSSSSSSAYDDSSNRSARGNNDSQSVMLLENGSDEIVFGVVGDFHLLRHLCYNHFSQRITCLKSILNMLKIYKAKVTDSLTEAEILEANNFIQTNIVNSNILHIEVLDHISTINGGDGARLSGMKIFKDARQMVKSLKIRIHEPTSSYMTYRNDWSQQRSRELGYLLEILFHISSIENADAKCHKSQDKGFRNLPNIMKTIFHPRGSEDGKIPRILSDDIFFGFSSTNQSKFWEQRIQQLFLSVFINLLDYERFYHINQLRSTREFEALEIEEERLRVIYPETIRKSIQSMLSIYEKNVGVSIMSVILLSWGTFIGLSAPLYESSEEDMATAETYFSSYCQIAFGLIQSFLFSPIEVQSTISYSLNGDIADDWDIRWQPPCITGKLYDLEGNFDVISRSQKISLKQEKKRNHHPLFCLAVFRLMMSCCSLSRNPDEYFNNGFAVFMDILEVVLLNVEHLPDYGENESLAGMLWDWSKPSFRIWINLGLELVSVEPLRTVLALAKDKQLGGNMIPLLRLSSCLLKMELPSLLFTEQQRKSIYANSAACIAELLDDRFSQQLKQGSYPIWPAMIESLLNADSEAALYTIDILSQLSARLSKPALTILQNINAVQIPKVHKNGVPLTFDDVVKLIADVITSRRKKHGSILISCLRALQSFALLDMQAVFDVISAQVRGQSFIEICFAQLIDIEESEGRNECILNFIKLISYSIEFAFKQRSELDMRDIFESFDENGDGRITPDEFRNGLNKMKYVIEKIDEETAEELVARFDTNRDHTIDYREFIRYLHEEEAKYLLFFSSDGSLTDQDGQRKEQESRNKINSHSQQLSIRLERFLRSFIQARQLQVGVAQAFIDNSRHFAIKVLSQHLEWHYAQQVDKYRISHRVTSLLLELCRLADASKSKIANDNLEDAKVQTFLVELNDSSQSSLTKIVSYVYAQQFDRISRLGYSSAGQSTLEDLIAQKATISALRLLRFFVDHASDGSICSLFVQSSASFASMLVTYAGYFYKTQGASNGQSPSPTQDFAWLISNHSMSLLEAFALSIGKENPLDQSTGFIPWFGLSLSDRLIWTLNGIFTLSESGENRAWYEEWKHKIYSIQRSAISFIENCLHLHPSIVGRIMSFPGINFCESLAKLALKPKDKSSGLFLNCSIIKLFSAAWKLSALGQYTSLSSKLMSLDDFWRFIGDTLKLKREEARELEETLRSIEDIEDLNELKIISEAVEQECTTIYSVAFAIDLIATEMIIESEKMDNSEDRFLDKSKGNKNFVKLIDNLQQSRLFKDAPDFSTTYHLNEASYISDLAVEASVSISVFENRDILPSARIPVDSLPARSSTLQSSSLVVGDISSKKSEMEYDGINSNGIVYLLEHIPRYGLTKSVDILSLSAVTESKSNANKIHHKRLHHLINKSCHLNLSLSLADAQAKFISSWQSFFEDSFLIRSSESFQRGESTLSSRQNLLQSYNEDDVYFWLESKDPSNVLEAMLDKLDKALFKSGTLFVKTLKIDDPYLNAGRTLYQANENEREQSNKALLMLSFTSNDRAYQYFLMLLGMMKKMFNPYSQKQSPAEYKTEENFFRSIFPGREMKLKELIESIISSVDVSLKVIDQAKLISSQRKEELPGEYMMYQIVLLLLEILNPLLAHLQPKAKRDSSLEITEGLLLTLSQATTCLFQAFSNQTLVTVGEHEDEIESVPYQKKRLYVASLDVIKTLASFRLNESCKNVLSSNVERAVINYVTMSELIWKKYHANELNFLKWLVDHSLDTLEISAIPSEYENIYSDIKVETTELVRSSSSSSSTTNPLSDIGTIIQQGADALQELQSILFPKEEKEPSKSKASTSSKPIFRKKNIMELLIENGISTLDHYAIIDHDILINIGVYRRLDRIRLLSLLRELPQKVDSSVNKVQILEKSKRSRETKMAWLRIINTKLHFISEIVSLGYSCDGDSPIARFFESLVNDQLLQSLSRDSFISNSRKDGKHKKYSLMDARGYTFPGDQRCLIHLNWCTVLQFLSDIVEKNGNSTQVLNYSMNFLLSYRQSIAKCLNLFHEEKGQLTLALADEAEKISLVIKSITGMNHPQMIELQNPLIRSIVESQAYLFQDLVFGPEDSSRYMLEDFASNLREVSKTGTRLKRACQFCLRSMPITTVEIELDKIPSERLTDDNLMSSSFSSSSSFVSDASSGPSSPLKTPPNYRKRNHSAFENGQRLDDDREVGTTPQSRSKLVHRLASSASSTTSSYYNESEGYIITKFHVLLNDKVWEIVSNVLVIFGAHMKKCKNKIGLMDFWSKEKSKKYPTFSTLYNCFRACYTHMRGIPRGGSLSVDYDDDIRGTPRGGSSNSVYEDDVKNIEFDSGIKIRSDFNPEKLRKKYRNAASEILVIMKSEMEFDQNMVKQTSTTLSQRIQEKEYSKFASYLKEFSFGNQKPESEFEWMMSVFSQKSKAPNILYTNEVKITLTVWIAGNQSHPIEQQLKATESESNKLAIVTPDMLQLDSWFDEKALIPQWREYVERTGESKIIDFLQNGGNNANTSHFVFHELFSSLGNKNEDINRVVKVLHQLTELVAKLKRQNNADMVIIGGNKAGAALALWFAKSFDFVKSIILLNGYPVLSEDFLQQLSRKENIDAPNIVLLSQLPQVEKNFKLGAGRISILNSSLVYLGFKTNLVECKSDADVSEAIKKTIIAST